MWDCASQLWVPGRSRVHGRPYLSLCPITLWHHSLCRWMQNSKRSRLVPFFVWWGHWKGWVVPQECPPQKVNASSKTMKKHPPGVHVKFWCACMCVIVGGPVLQVLCVCLRLCLHGIKEQYRHRHQREIQTPASR